MTDQKFMLSLVWVFSFSTIQKIMLSSAEDRIFSRTYRFRGQVLRLELRGQGQRLQNVFKDSTSVDYYVVSTLGLKTNFNKLGGSLTNFVPEILTAYKQTLMENFVQQ